jgi:bacillithiol biosynthesis cysteine-adding enzyme BshC
LILHLFGNTGLVMFNPQDPEAKRLLRPLFRRCVENNSEICRALLERNRALEESGFAPQVSLPDSSTLLFLTENNQRRALTRHDDQYGLKNSGHRFTEADLLQMVDSSPEVLSPNVLLRPLAQDHLFPTVAYVAGPAEVAYFAQAETLYRIYERPMPVIWPRAGFTLVEPEIAVDMDRYTIRLEDLFQGRQHLVEKAVQATDHAKAMSILNTLEQELGRNLDELRPALSALDPSLDHASETTKRKVLHHVEPIRGRFARIEAGQNNQLLRTIDRILNSCYPNRNLQEREFSVHPFLARHGLDLLGAIHDLLKPEDFTHHVVYLQ